MNPKLWISWFYALPAWPCPHCGLGTLHLDGEVMHKVPEGILEILEPDELNGPFSAWMKCSNQDCRAHVAVQGSFDVVDRGDGYDEPDYQHRYYPVALLSAPPIIKVPDDTPEAISLHVQRSFTLYWTDLNACVGAVRTALERIADDQGIPTHHEGGRKLMFGQRVELMKASHPHLAEAIEVLKDIGNEGAHEDEVDRDRVLVAFKLLETELEDLYANRKKRRAQWIAYLKEKKK